MTMALIFGQADYIKTYPVSDETPDNGDALIFNSSTGEWEPGAVSVEVDWGDVTAIDCGSFA